MRKFIIGILATLVISGTAMAQTPVGPDYFTSTNTGTTGVKILLNSDYAKTPTPKSQIYLLSESGGFKVSGWRYTNSTWTKVFPVFSSAAADTIVPWIEKEALPIYAQIDLLYIVHDNSGGTVKGLIYK